MIRLWDTRILALECKESNSSTNSIKRLNNGAAAKAKTWLAEFGTKYRDPQVSTHYGRPARRWLCCSSVT
ncbi:MAG: XamI family restriction endonuclease [Proteobacteria bacterium]|nr:XamI family restriction endonuclease [Pseudomonadota bacterium]